MAEILIQAGARVDIPTRAEVREDMGHGLHEAVSTLMRERARGVKFMRIPQIYGTAASSKLSIGAGIAQTGPDSGYIWSLMRVVVSGLTTGATPDVVNLYVNDTSSQPLWQFNGNNFGYTFGPGEMIINGGENILLASVGTFNATGTIILSGGLVELPAEMAGKLLES